jgi:ankyrin repeat protein
MKELARKNTVRDVRRALSTLQHELDDFHREAIRRIESQNREDRQLAEKILLWVSYSLRTLTFNELLHALAIEPGKPELDQMGIPKEIDVESLCAGLIVVDRNSKLVHFVHFTAQRYFETIRGTRFPDAQASIAIACLTYLLFDVFATDLCTSHEEWDARLQKYPLLDYAARHWGTHAREEQEGASTELALRLLAKKQNMLCAVQAMLRHDWIPSRYSVEHVTGLHVVAKFGLGQVARRVLANGADVNAEDGSNLTALHIAAQLGHTQVVQVLLERADINVNLQNGFEQTPLLLAAEMGHQDVVKLLVGRDDVWLNAKDDEDWTALLCALDKGYEAVAQQLLSTDRFTANSKDEDGRTPLSYAAEKELSAAVHWLLARSDVDVDSEDNQCRTPLFWATHGSGEVMRQLLEEGKAQINKPDIDGSTALHEAVKQLFEEGVVLLLEHEADAEAEDEREMSAMDVALFWGNVRMVEVLLANGVRLRMDRNGDTALHAIVYNSNDQFIRWIRSDKEKREVNITWCNNGLPPGLAGGLGRYDEMVQLLVDNQIDINGRNKDGQTPLHTATIERHETLVKILLKHQANIDADDREGATPLHLATYLGNDAIAQVLLEHHANIEARARQGTTPLHVSAQTGNRR